MNPNFQQRRERTDRFVAHLVKVGGVAVVGVVLFMAIFLIVQSAPLAKKPSLVGPVVERQLNIENTSPIILQGVEPFLEASYALFADGELCLFDIKTGEKVSNLFLSLEGDEQILRGKLSTPQDGIAFLTTQNRLGWLPLSFDIDYSDELVRSHKLAPLGDEVVWVIDEGAVQEISDFSIRDEEDKIWASVVVRDGPATLMRLTKRTNRLTKKVSIKKKSISTVGGQFSSTTLLDGGIMVVANSSALFAMRPDRQFKNFLSAGEWSIVGGLSIESLHTLVGGGSFIALREGPQINRFLMRVQEKGASQLAEASTFPPLELGQIKSVTSSPRQRLFFLQGENHIQALQGTFGSSVAKFSSLGSSQLQLAPREDALVDFFPDGKINIRPINLGFVEATGEALFGKLQYEGLSEPSYTWQSTGGSDAYESKISFVPLVIGTLKGTLWTLLPSIPLALLSALYCARFLRGRAREIIKPALELLAGIPSVILGFIGALYIAPAVEDRFLSLFLLPVVLVIVSALFAFIWARIPLEQRKRLHEGLVAFGLIPIYFLISWAVFAFGPDLEMFFLGQPFREWAPNSLGVPFEQRNSIVVGLAMGFAVTPLIFTLAEDAFRNIPKDLADASLALGATSWQTAIRVIVPPAVPGVVAAIMLGLGRAVGETMVVLMATGNTAITDWNPLQGFRALSANLAVELPEADHGGGLYRVLFLSALLLFLITFVVNTVAEIIRVRGRKQL